MPAHVQHLSVRFSVHMGELKRHAGACAARDITGDIAVVQEYELDEVISQMILVNLMISRRSYKGFPDNQR